MEATAGILAFLAGGHPGIDLETKTESELERLVIPAVAGALAGGSTPPAQASSGVGRSTATPRRPVRTLADPRTSSIAAPRTARSHAHGSRSGVSAALNEARRTRRVRQRQARQRP